MRQRTRRVVLAVLVAVALLLALGALPSHLRSGDPYHLTATPAAGNGTAVNASALPADRYPYVTAALADAGPNATGHSAAYYRGPVGLKGAFTHSPFDELAALRAQHPDATVGDAVRVRANGTVFRLAVGGAP